MRIEILAVGAAGLLSCVLCSSASAEGPITSISGKMTTVAGDLAKTVTGEPVQNRQKEIVKDLDDLIASLEKQCQQCKNGMVKNNPTGPAQQSTLRKGTGGIGDLITPREAARIGRRSRRGSATVLSSPCPRGSPPSTAWSSSATTGVWPRRRPFPRERKSSKSKTEATGTEGE